MGNITNSTITQQRRNQLKSLQDEFCTFSWGGEDAFEKFGAFIINDKKGSLKFYNGPGFSNEYTKPQFDNAGGVLQGVSFKKQTIDFMIGVYWFSIEEYRRLLNWLHPLKVSYLQFGFNPHFRYDVKLSNIGDSTRWVIGKENGEPRYYTELKLSFELQGSPCAKGVQPYQFFSRPVTSSDQISSGDRYWNFSKLDTGEVSGKAYLNIGTNDFIPSDLESPVQIKFALKLESDGLEANYFSYDGLTILGDWSGEDGILLHDKLENEEIAVFQDESESLDLDLIIDDSQAEYEIQLYAGYEDIHSASDTDKYDVLLCSFTLQHLALFVEKGYSLNFTYFSETGLLFLSTNEPGAGSLLSQQTFTDSGEFLVKSLETHKFMLPGAFDHPEFYQKDTDKWIYFKLKYSKKGFKNSEWTQAKINSSCYKDQPISIECYPRTNII